MRTKILLLFLSVLLAVPNFIKKNINGEPVYNKLERFDPSLANINSIDKLEKYVDDSAAVTFINIYSEKYTALLAYIISCRFYHGFSHFKLNENWIASVGEKIFGYGLDSKVEPEQIMQHPYAGCSQQAIVMMAVLRRKNISYRKIGFPHHYAIEAMINKHWYFFDPNMEPAISLEQRSHEKWKGYNDSLKRFYNPATHNDLNYQLGNGVAAQYGAKNEIPAGNARFFQNVTSFLSKILWCCPLVFVFIKRRRPKMYAVKPVNHFPRNSDLQPFFYA